VNDFFKRNWWKMLSGILLLYAVIIGFQVNIPAEIYDKTQETFRNLFYHVGMWFGMFAMLITSFIYSLRFLRKFDMKEDIAAVEAVNVGLLFGFLGIITGMIWANFTWGAPWTKDPKLNGAAVGLVIYLAYTILRGSIEDVYKKAKVSAVYNIFAFVLWIVFVLVLPRITSGGLHPASKGEANMVMPMSLTTSIRIVFYPAMIGWILLGFWIMNLRVRMRKIKSHLENQ
jgi:heme exporter protein C